MIRGRATDRGANVKFTDVFIHKPVLACVISLVILLLGLRAAMDLSVRQYPHMENAVITVSTPYVGADADLIQGFVTTPLERQIASAEGIDYIVSSSTAGFSSIRAFLNLDANAAEVLTQISGQVDKMRAELPEGAEDPIVDIAEGEQIHAMYMAFYSDILEDNQITDYLVRVVQPLLSTVAGVQQAEILGARTFATRVWLQPDRMTALNISASDVHAALRANNVLSAVGATRGRLVSVDLSAHTDLQDADAFADLVIREDQGAIVRLGDIARIELGAENYTTAVRFQGSDATFIGIEVAPDANSLDVLAAVREVWDKDIIPELPEGLGADIPYDSSEYIEGAIYEVIITIILAVLIVILVIYLFLGSLRSVLIPTLAIPLSLIGTMLLMLLMGFSLNLLTLLAMVLAIGIVVDDAIIVLENIHRHIEEGMQPFDAAIQGARELAWPVVAMSTTVTAVYIPVGFMGGLSGTLFVEFAFTLAASVILSGVVALTLSPMLCSKLLKPHAQNSKGRFEEWLDNTFDRLQERYRNGLHSLLNDRHVVAIFGGIILFSCYFLFNSASHELAPEEDQGFILAITESDPYATMEYYQKQSNLVAERAMEIPEMDKVFMVDGGMTPGGGETTREGFTGMVLKPWGERSRTTMNVLYEDIMIDKAVDVPGLRVSTFQPPPLPSGGEGMPVQFVIGTTRSVGELQEFTDQILDRARQSGHFFFVNSDLNIDMPRMSLNIDRDKVATMGIDMQALSRDLGAWLSGGHVNYFALDNRSYKVIPQIERGARLNPEQILELRTRTGDGELVPLSTFATLEESVEPRSLNRFQQLNSVTLSGAPMVGFTLGEALQVLEDSAADILPDGYRIDYGGQSRQLRAEGAQLLVTFGLALIIIYLVLAAQFESWRDPLIMLVAVPMSIFGALAFVSIGVVNLNIYTQVGMLTLVGVITKHGILMVEFANKLQEQGLSKRAAIEAASSIRLRPILMTTASLVLAMIPLLLSSGPGAGARFAMGIIIVTGMTIGTLFTLFVLPAMYLYLGRDRGNQGEQLDNAQPA